MIILEGVDNSGKSTLASKISARLQWPIIESEGPPKSHEEFNARIRRYNAFTEVIAVRHPVISESLYCMLRNGEDIIEPELRRQFYALKPLIIYCDPLDRGTRGHSIKAHDTPEHLAALERRYAQLLVAYRSWALRQADIIYRIGDGASRILKLVQGAMFSVG